MIYQSKTSHFVLFRHSRTEYFVGTIIQMSDLWTTARSNDVEGMRLLFSKGIGLKARDEKGYSFLHHAAERGASKMVTFLLDRGIEADVTDNQGFTV